MDIANVIELFMLVIAAFNLGYKLGKDVAASTDEAETATTKH